MDAKDIRKDEMWKISANFRLYRIINIGEADLKCSIFQHKQKKNNFREKKECEKIGNFRKMG